MAVETTSGPEIRQNTSRKRPVVLHLVESFNQGGSERQALQLAAMLKRSSEYDVEVSTIKPGGILRASVESLGFREISTYPLTSFHDWNFVVQARRLARSLRAAQVEIIHTHDFYTNILGMAAGKLAGVPARIASRRDMGDLRTSAQNWLERRAYGFASCVVANCDAVKSNLISQGVPANKIVRIYNSVDFSRVQVDPALSREEVRARLGLPSGGNQKCVTMVANFRLAVKDHATLLRAFSLVRQTMPDTRFALAGEGELQPKMEALARELGISASVQFIGRCERLAELLFASDICVLSSKSEGLPNVILEYMAASRPVVATDVGGVREAVIDGETGYIVRNGDSSSMADRIVALLRDPEKAADMGRRGRERALKQFSTDAHLESVRGLYARILAR